MSVQLLAADVDRMFPVVVCVADEIVRERFIEPCCLLVHCLL
ncbi:hypothetical protein SAMN05216564_105127 [Halopenitus persicus]|uniref:Uncharacterized protein n=1 Tax=Halopenitus persicus TaxID=1048396 RepID=A0A1H3JSH0_9EURY|nr:hypothetical protein SAMN05216564_105127 [Halopenitus persicus]